MAKKLLSKDLEHTCALHMHSDFSVGDGAAKITDYMKMFKEIGINASAITDHGSLGGILEFYKQAKKNGINPLIGCEFYLNDLRDVKEKDGENDEDNENPDDFRNNHLIITAKNEQGIKSIIKINNEAVLNGFFGGKPRTTTEKIFEMGGNDILISSACLAGFPARMILNNKIPELKKRLSTWKERFGDDFYLEMQFNEVADQHIVNRELIKLGKELKIKTIIAQDCHYVEEGDDFLQLLKMMARTKKSLRDLEDGIPKGMWIFEAKELFVKTNSDIIKTAKKFKYDIPQNIIIESLINNHEWNYKTKVNWDLSVKHYNKFPPPSPFKTSEEYFVKLVVDGLNDFIKKGWIPKEKFDEYSARIKYETKILISKGYVDYLLETRRAIMEVVNVIGDPAHVNIGRGSAGACLCAFLLGIHKIDPIKHDLLFDRFLSEARSNEMIDINID